MHHTTAKSFSLKCYLTVWDVLSFFLKKLSRTIPKKPVKKILVCNLAHLGDVVISTSVLKVLEQKYPHASVSFLVQSTCKEILEGLNLDRIHTIDHPKTTRNKQGIVWNILEYFRQQRRLKKTIEKESYDFAIDLNVFYPNAAFLFFLAKIPITVGFTSTGGRHFLEYGYKFEKDNEFLGKKYIEMLGKHCELTSIPKLEYPLIFTSREPRATGFVVIHMEAGDKKKQLPFDYWKKIVDLIPNNKQLVFTGLTAFKDEINALQKDKGEKRIICEIGKTGIQRLKEILKGAEYVISIDTFISHLSFAASTPCFTVFKEKDPMTLFGMNTSRHRCEYYLDRVCEKILKWQKDLQI